MFKIYGSELCPDCVACKLNFDTYGIDYTFIDITKSMRDLSAFLKLRDNDPVFDHSKEIGDIGIPALIKEDGTVFLSWEKYLEEKGLKVMNADGAACGIGGKGC